ncbi:branched-chain amino acid ABC transporter substrate-binding protein [Teichococcus deserti]|uniref:branched-chain amino acid ABC transporter substrate-binding protein n=1 Tax=Teichococcus deserti TaxID=1817963 RepID=UPI001A96662B|nr:branched-chain amino acid ABC transporter substrate-binding protein [Pseudoroseomonas deserti]
MTILSSVLPRRLTALALAAGLLAGPAGLARAETLGPVTDPVGVVRIPRGAPILIGGLMVLSGPDLSLGLDASRGAEIAFDDRRNVLVGHPIRYLPEDGQCSVEGGQTGATRLAANRQIVGVIGTACSSEARGGAPILWNAGMPQAVTSATAPALTAPDRPVGLQGTVRFVYNDINAAAAAVRYAQAQTFTRVATLHDGSLYAEQLVRAFEAQFKAAGGTIVAAEAVAASDSDLRPVLTRIGTAKPELIFAPIFVGATAYLVRQAKEIGSLAGTPVLGTDAVMAPAFLEAAGDAAIGYRMTGINNDPAVLGQRYVDFRAKYLAKFGENPIGGFHGNGYDAALAMMLAIERVAVKDAEGNTYIGRAALRDALMRTAGLDGITGRLSCDPHGDCGASRFAVFEYTSGDPGSFQEGKNPRRVFQ